MPLDAPDAGNAPAADQQPDVQAVLARLNQIAAAANALTGGDPAAADRFWGLFSRSVVDLTPDISVAFFGYLADRQQFCGLPSAAAGRLAGVLAGSGPLLAALGQAAVRQARPAWSDGEPKWVIPPALRSAGVQVAAAFPWLSAGESLGVLYAGLAEERRFTPVEMSWLETVAGLAAAAAYRLGAAEEEQRILGGAFGAMGEFAANLMHHVNNRIGTIPVRVEGIQDKFGDLLSANAYLAANLAQIRDSATEALAALRASLAILEPGSGGVVSPGLGVTQAVAAARLPADVTVSIADLSRLPPVYAGPESLALVIATVLQDAAPSASGAVTIGGTLDDGYVELAIRGPLPAGNGYPDRTPGPAMAGPAGRAIDTDPDLWWLKMSLARLGGTVIVQNEEGGGRTFRLRLRAVGGDQDGG